MQSVLVLFLSTGMRPNEVASLKIKDFDIENNLIKIHDTKLHKDRTIPIHESVSIKIKEYILYVICGCKTGRFYFKKYITVKF